MNTTSPDGPLACAPFLSDETVVLPDGRRLGYAVFGDPGGHPVLHFHGALSSRWEGFWLRRGAQSSGVRLITVDRPGIGSSDLKVGRRVADWPGDVEHLVRHLALDQFSILGVSGGAPYAVACAAAFGDRMKRLAVVAGIGPVAEPAVFALMTRRQRVLLGLLMRSPRLLRSFVFALKCLPDVAGLLVLTATLGGLSPADLRLISSPPVREDQKRLPPGARQAAFGQTVDGPAWDGHLHSRPWEVDFSAIQSEVDLWYADDDRIVSSLMGRCLEARFPRSKARYFPGEGHLALIIERAGQYLEALVSPGQADLQEGRSAAA